MRRTAVLGLSLLVLAGCGPTTTKDAADLSVTGCGTYERSRLQGMRIGASIRPADPNTEHGRAALEEMRFLEAICDPPPAE